MSLRKHGGRRHASGGVLVSYVTILILSSNLLRRKDTRDAAPATGRLFVAPRNGGGTSKWAHSHNTVQRIASRPHSNSVLTPPRIQTRHSKPTTTHSRRSSASPWTKSNSI